MWRSLIAVLVLGGSALSQTPSTGLESCAPQVNGQLRIRVSEGVIRGSLAKATKYVDGNLKHDAPTLKGKIEVQLLIDREGKVACAEVMSSDSPLLIPGALEFAKSLKFRPFLLDRKPLVVETHITVRESKGVFELAQTSLPPR